MVSYKKLRSSFKQPYAVIGLGFGDEGKGLTVNSLCKDVKNPLVIRYNGGHQAGHTVTMDDGESHIFSNFGSGSWQGAETYWSKYCTFDPVGVQREFNIFRKKNGNPVLYVDKNAPVTTPFEKNYNKRSDAMKHGTCGVGVSATYKREAANCSLLVGDLLTPAVVEMKLQAIMTYYVEKHGMGTITPDQLEGFLNACEFVRKSSSIHVVPYFHAGPYDQVIFEGAQGLLLDQNIGFFPHVTPSNTGTKNILEMGHKEPWCFLVTRAYQTRHGNGPMTNEKLRNDFIIDNPKETNQQNDFQGKFRKTMLDLDLLKYAIGRDDYINMTYKKTLVVTCLDQMQVFMYTADGKVVAHKDQISFLKGISKFLKIKNVLACASPQGVFEEYDFENE